MRERIMAVLWFTILVRIIHFFKLYFLLTNFERLYHRQVQNFLLLLWYGEGIAAGRLLRIFKKIFSCTLNLPHLMS